MPEESKELIEAELLRKIASGDQAAFAEFYDRFSGVMFSLAIKILRDPKEAEDVLQDVFWQVWERASSFDARLGKPLSWALTFTRNKAIDRLRATQRRTRLAETIAIALEDAADRSRAHEAICLSEHGALIRSALKDLPPEQREAIELAFFSGLTQSDISAKLREPLGTVKARIRRGLLKLREALEKAL